jgi:hypothetical protein
MLIGRNISFICDLELTGMTALHHQIFMQWYGYVAPCLNIHLDKCKNLAESQIMWRPPAVFNNIDIKQLLILVY